MATQFAKVFYIGDALPPVEPVTWEPWEAFALRLEEGYCIVERGRGYADGSAWVSVYSTHEQAWHWYRREAQS